jgi:hypothetical protein
MDSSSNQRGPNSFPGLVAKQDDIGARAEKPPAPHSVGLLHRGERLEGLHVERID